MTSTAQKVSEALSVAASAASDPLCVTVLTDLREWFEGQMRDEGSEVGGAMEDVRRDIATLRENGSDLLPHYRRALTVMEESLDPEGMPTLDEIIAHVESTPEESWWAGPTFRSPDQSQHCVLSHIAERFGGDAMDLFEGRWSTSYVIGAANDGRHPGYPQPTAKQRCVAFLHALRDGTEKDTLTSMDEQFRDCEAQRRA